jgi:hypothetical protein
MKDSIISSLELEVKIKKKVFKSLSKETGGEDILQESCLCRSLAKNRLPVGLKFSSRKFRYLLAYLIIFFYFPLEESIFCYMYLDLQDFIRCSQAYWLCALTSNKDIFIKYLVVQKTMSEQQFFSGICNEQFLRQVLKSISLRFEERLRNPRRVIRRKGYKDKGSLGTLSSTALNKGVKEDSYLTMLQFLKEGNDELKSDKIQLLGEYLQGTRDLTDELLIEFRIIPGGKENEQTDRYSEIKNYIERRSNQKIVDQERKHRQELELYGPEARKAENATKTTGK